MESSDFRYVDVALGGFNRRNNVMALSELVTILQNSGLGKAFLDNYFRSVFLFDRSYLEHVRSSGSVANFNGSCRVQFVPIDIDAHDQNMQGAVTTLFGIIAALESYNVDNSNILIDFSGGGFHVEIPAGLFQPAISERNPEIAESFVRELALNLADADRSHIDWSVYQTNHLWRIRCTRNVKEESSTGPFKVNINQCLAQIKSDAAFVPSLGVGPAVDAISQEFLDGSWHFSREPISQLCDLWSRCSQPKPRSAVFTGAGLPALSKAPACVKAILSAFVENKLDQGSRNKALCAVALYLRDCGLPEGLVEIVAQELNSALVSPVPASEVTSTVASMMRHPYRLPCGMKDGWLSLTDWCAGSCLSVASRPYVGVDEAHQEMLRYLARGISPYAFGIPVLDDLVGGLRPGKAIALQSYPTVGKTLLALRFLRHLAEVAQMRGELIFFMSPEQYPDEVSEYLTMAMASLTLESVYSRVLNGGLPSTVTDWFLRMGDTVKVAMTAGYDVTAIDRLVQSVERDSKKKVAILFYDGTTMLRSNVQNRKEQEIVSELVAMTRMRNVVSFFCVHVPKDEGKRERDVTQKEPGLMAAHGTAFYGNFMDIILSLYRDQDCLMISPKKVKRRYRGQVSLPPPIRMFIDRYFMCYTKEEALAMDPSVFTIDPRCFDVPEPPPEFRLRS